MTDSSTGGYLLPGNAIAPPLEDAALDDFLHDVVAGVTGLNNTLVYPRWQEEPPNLPARNVDWCAFGIQSRSAQTFAVVQHDSAGDGTDVVTRHEELDLMASFYGPNAQGYGALLRDGLAVAQNREQLYLAGMGLIGVGDVSRAPELLKSKWYSRADLPVQIRREVRRSYPVLNLLSAAGVIRTDVGDSNFNTSP